MPSSSADFSQQILNQLKVIMPDLSADPLTPERKIIDTIAEVLSEGSIEPYLLNYQLDIDTKVGSDLDKFVALFGFSRQAGRAATGLVTFGRNSPATSDIVILTGTSVQQPATSVTSSVTFVTSSPGILPMAGNSVDVPVVCSQVGQLGNVPAGTIVSLIGGGQGNTVSTVINAVATSGGTDAESDAQLRVRFKNTIFRNVSGTQDQYLALAIATSFASKANVIGPISRFIEYIQVESDLNIASLIPYSKFTYFFDYYLTNGDVANETFYTPNGIDYSFTASVPPVVSVTNTTTLPIGAVVLLEHAYCSTNSRNDPGAGIANYVDIYVNGENISTATETISFASTTTAFTSGTGGTYDVQNFVRVATGQEPNVGNILQELLWQPIADLPSVITIQGVDYFENVDYWQVRDNTVYKGSKRARDGIEWGTSIIGQVTSGTIFTINYDFNKLPLVLNELVDDHKQITSDVLVHQATNRYFNINFIVMYSAGFSRTSVDTALTASLSNFLNTQQFGALLQLSDILEIGHEVPGVDNVRLAMPVDGVAYGIQEVASDGVTVLGAPYTTDFALQDSDLPIVNAVITTQRSQNTW